MDTKKLLLIVLSLMVAFVVKAQSKPVIVDQDKGSVTVKYSGEYISYTCLDLAEAMATGTMCTLKLPFSEKAQLEWTKTDAKMKSLNSMMGGAGLKERLMVEFMEKFFTEPHTLKEFIDKAVLGDGKI